MKCSIFFLALTFCAASAFASEKGNASVSINPSVDSITVDIDGAAAEAIYNALKTPEVKDAELPVYYKDIRGGYYCSKTPGANGFEYVCILKVSAQ